MTTQKLYIGNSDFKTFIEEDKYFVDKSLFIQEILDIQSQVILLPRPRRFGKTLNLSMLRYFFDKNQPENKILFKDLKIWQTDEATKQNCCRYPVVFMSFKDAKANTWEKVFKQIKFEIIKIYNNHRYLLEKNILYCNEKDFFEKLLSGNVDDTDLEVSLKKLSEYLYRYHKEKIVILIDEYDTPIQAGYDKYYDEVVSFMRNFLSGAFKDNSFLFKGVITGILRVSKESIFSGLNNLGVFSILNYDFSDKFGFTEEEVKKILEDFELTEYYDGIKKWYNGYKFGQSENIYNPWSILNFVSRYRDGFQPYWANTSSNELIKREIRNKKADDIRSEILDLISGKPIVKDIEENFVFTDLIYDKDLIWTLLFFSGYLTVNKKISRREIELTIPNYELKIIFQDTILDWLRIEVKIQQKLLLKTVKSLINNDINAFEQGFKKIIGDTFSYYDTAKNHEYVYQAYLLGLLAIIGDDYIIKSNKESGEGRYDIMLIPHNKSNYGIVMELKQIRKQKESESREDFIERVNKNLDVALNQINQNKYYKEIIDNGIAEDRIIKVPVIFAGKEPYITKQTIIE